MKKTISFIISLMLVIALALPAAAFSSVPVKSLKVDKDKITLNVNQTARLIVTLSPSNTTQKQVKYVTSNKNVVSVDKDGKITAVGLGNATITVVSSSNSNVTAKCNVTVALDSKVAEKTVQLSWYFMGGKLQDQAAVEAEINKYLKPRINATLKLYPLEYNDLIQKMTLMSFAGTPYDIQFEANWLDYKVAVEKNRFIPLESNGLLDKYAPNIRKVLGNDILNAAKVEGILFGIPVNKDIATSSGYLFRKDLVDKYKFNIDKIKTNADVEAMLKVIKEKEPSVVPADGMWFPAEYEFISVTGNKSTPGAVRQSKKDFKVINEYDTPEFKAYSEMTRKWVGLGLLEKDSIAKQDSHQARIKQGAFFAVVSNTKPGKAIEMSNENVKYVQKRMTDIYVDGEAPLGALQCISRTSSNKERALMLLDLMYTDKKLYNMVINGIEGKHYKKLSENVIEPIGKKSYDNNGNQWQFANQLLCFLKKEDNPNKWTEMGVYNRGAKPFITNGFVYSGVDKFKSEYTACANVLKEYGDPLKAGVADPAKGIAEMTAKLKNAGMDKYLADIQAELDKWAKANQKK